MRTAISLTFYGYIALGVAAFVLYVTSLPLSLPIRVFSGTNELTGSLVIASPVERYENGAQIVLPQGVPLVRVYTLRGTAVEAGATYLLAEGGSSLRAREVYGAVAYTVPLLGHVLTFAYSIFGVVALFVAPLLMVFVHKLAASVAGARQFKQEEHEYVPLAHA